MKKKKFNLLLNIATLCLCVAAIAFGVYSAKNASLNVSGTVGFNAHNIDYTAKVYMYGHSGTDGKPVQEANKVTLTNTGSDKINFELGNQTFSDLGDSGEPETIYVVIEVTNNSDFNVALKANLSLCTTADANILIDTPKDDSARILASKTGTADARKGTIKYTLNVKKNTNGEYPEIPTTYAVTLKVDLAKTDLTAGTPVRADLPVAIKEFTPEEVKPIRKLMQNTVFEMDVDGLTDEDIDAMAKDAGISKEEAIAAIEQSKSAKCYAERYPYYIEMGQVTGVTNKVNWLIVGTNENDTLTTLTDTDKQALSEGLMLNKTYTMLSEKVLYTESTANYGISFQNSHSESLLTPKYPNTKNPAYSAQDYATSNVRSYLKGNTVQRVSTSANSVYSPSGTEVNLMTTYNLANDKMYNKIQGRTLTSLYTNIGTPSGTIWSEATDDGKTDKTNDKLWLLSEKEMKEVFKFTEDYVDSAYRVSAITTTYGNIVSNVAAWWLRSPGTGRANNMLFVNALSKLENVTVDNITTGVRAAFLF